MKSASSQRSATNSVSQRQQRPKGVSPPDSPEDLQSLVDSVSESITHYSRKHPAAVAGMAFFLGFYVGWKVKPW